MADPTVNTLNALTNEYRPERLVSQVFKGTAVLDAFLRRMRVCGGKEIKFAIEYGYLNGAWRDYNETRTLTSSPEIATEGTLGWKHCVVDVHIEQLNEEYNRTDPTRIADYLDRYVRAALATIRDEYVNNRLFRDQSGKSMYSITDAVNDTQTYAGIDNTWTGLSHWRSVIGEADYGSPSIPVYPYLENFSKMIRLIWQVSGKKPDMIVTSGAVYDKLREQINSNDFVSAIRKSSTNVAWGYTDISIDQVPVVVDLEFEAAQCTDFNPSGTSRATCGGHQALFLNFDHLYMYCLRTRNFSWDRSGWRSELGATNWINHLYFTGGVVCTCRKQQGRLFGIDPTADPTKYKLISDSQTNKSAFTS